MPATLWDFLSVLAQIIQPRDVIAIITVICGTLLLALGIDGVVGTWISAIVLLYFGAGAVQKLITPQKP